jgi:hypothetical protein
LRLATAGPRYSCAEAGEGESEIRNPKSETRKKSEFRSPKEIRIPKPEIRSLKSGTQSPRIVPSSFGFRSSGFIRISEFGFRISDGNPINDSRGTLDQPAGGGAAQNPACFPPGGHAYWTEHCMNADQPPSTSVALLCLVAVWFVAPVVTAQSVDGLLEKLVEKGILTAQEARDLRAEAGQDGRPPATRSGMAGWVKDFEFHGDLRGRFEGFYGENPAFTDRDRFRYRLRFGVTVSLLDDFEVGLRLTSSEGNGGFGGDPISGNASFSDNGSKKFVYFDTAYARWSPLHTERWAGELILGKQDLPFHFPSTMVFDHDYTPEGLAGRLQYHVDERHTLEVVGGAFVLDELSLSGRDPWLGGAQWLWLARWNPRWSSALGLAGFFIGNEENLLNDNVPNIGRGNTRTAAGAPAYPFNPIYAALTVTRTVESFPLYPGALPLSVSADYVNNPAAPTANQGWSAGFQIGKAGRKRAWEAVYRYQLLEADAWFEEFPESDFGAYYQQQQPYAGFATSANPTGAGYGSGTNVRGHWLRLAYSPFDSFTLGITCYFTELIRPTPAGSPSGMTRLQVDGTWRF